MMETNATSTNAWRMRNGRGTAPPAQKAYRASSHPYDSTMAMYRYWNFPGRMNSGSRTWTETADIRRAKVIPERSRRRFLPLVTSSFRPRPRREDRPTPPRRDLRGRQGGNPLAVGERLRDRLPLADARPGLDDGLFDDPVPRGLCHDIHRLQDRDAAGDHSPHRPGQPCHRDLPDQVADERAA